MKRLAVVFILFALFLMACELGVQPQGGNNNPNNLNTPNPNNPAQDINTATAPTPLAPPNGTPIGEPTAAP